MGLSWRTLVLAGAVVALAVWIFAIDLPRERRTIERQIEESQLLPIDPAVVDTLRVEHPQHPFTVVRRDDAWWITRPIVERAETRTVESVLDRLTSARSQRSMAPDFADDAWANYGLSDGHPGRSDIVLASSDGERVALAVGNTVVTGDYVYVRRAGSDALELADEAIFDLANSTHHGYRRVDLFDIADDAVVRIAMDGPGGRWAAVRDTSTGLWTADAAARTRYKRWIMDDMALAVAEQRVQAYLRDGLDDAAWSAYGLDDPWGELDVTTADGRTQTLWLGNERDEGQFFARKRGLDTVFVVRPQFVGALDAGTVGLEDFNPIPANLRRATAFRVVDEQGRWAEIRPSGRDWLDWTLIGPDGEVPSSDYRQTAADNLARGLEEMQPERSLYLPSGGDPGALLSERFGEVTIRFAERTLELHFGWREGETKAWFHLEGDPSLYEVERGMALRIRSFVDALRSEDAG